MLVLESLDPFPLPAERIRQLLEHTRMWKPWNIELKPLSQQLAAEITLESLVIDEQIPGMDGYRIVAMPGFPYTRYWEVVRYQGRRIGSREIVHKDHFMQGLLESFATVVTALAGNFLHIVDCERVESLTYALPLYRQLFIDSLTCVERPRLVPRLQLPPEAKIYDATHDLFDTPSWNFYSSVNFTLNQEHEIPGHPGFRLRIEGERGNCELDQHFTSHQEAICRLIDALLNLTDFNTRRFDFDRRL